VRHLSLPPHCPVVFLRNWEPAILEAGRAVRVHPFPSEVRPFRRDGDLRNRFVKALAMRAGFTKNVRLIATPGGVYLFVVEPSFPSNALFGRPFYLNGSSDKLVTFHSQVVMASVTLIHPEKTFTVPLLQTTDKCSLFQSNPALLASPDRGSILSHTLGFPGLSLGVGRKCSQDYGHKFDRACPVMWRI
jgi:hypothetical protein